MPQRDKRRRLILVGRIYRAGQRAQKVTSVCLRLRRINRQQASERDEALELNWIHGQNLPSAWQVHRLVGQFDMSKPLSHQWQRGGGERIVVTFTEEQELMFVEFLHENKFFYVKHLMD